MYNYYCKNCNNIVGEWDDEYNYHNISNYCILIHSKKFKTIIFLDCKHCDKFIGIECWNVCTNCFGKDIIIGEKNLFNWFQQYKKIITYNNYCKICNKDNLMWQTWFFEELTFYKQ